MPKKDRTVDLSKVWSNSRKFVFLQATAYTIITMAVLGGGGYYLDQLLKTSPIIFIVGLVISFPVTQIILYRKMKKFAQSKAE